MYTDYGRCCRPLFIVEDQAIKVGRGRAGPPYRACSQPRSLTHRHHVPPTATTFRPPALQVKKKDIIALQNREETGFTWQSMIEAGFIE